MVVMTFDPPDSESPTPTQTIPRSALRSVSRRPGRIKLRVLDGPAAGQERVLDSTKVRVGRSMAADMRIDHESMSGLHFELRLTKHGVELFDLASKNGTTLLGRRVFHACLQPGDVVVAGSCSIELVETSEIEVEESIEAREDGLLGVSSAMRELFAVLDKIAPREIPVLVTGESGTGKDLVSRAIHRRSRRAKGPFVVLDCGALAQSLAESALFGHRKGAFTGANEDWPGVFEQANGGTLFIDEIGELPLALQVKLLRTLESREVVRVGEVKPRRVSVRVVAATHRDLRRMVEEGTFREDLYFRLARFVVEIPPLRERGPDEVAYLADNLLNRIMAAEGISVALGTDAVEALQKHSWPGNVRELRNVIEQASVRCEGGHIRAKDLLLEHREQCGLQLEELIRLASYTKAHHALDRWLLPRILDGCGGNVSEAARTLDVGRKKLILRLQALGIYSGSTPDSDE